jgi:hypothetical protein
MVMHGGGAGGHAGSGHVGGGHLPSHAPHSAHSAAQRHDALVGASAPWYTEAARYHARPSTRRGRIATSIAAVLFVAVLVLFFTVS